MTLWKAVFDDSKFEEADSHHFSWGALYKVEDAEVLAEARRLVDYEAAMNVKPPPLDIGESEGHRYERWVRKQIDAALGVEASG